MDDKEYKILAELSKNGHTSQRDISQNLDLSLGMVNIILKRLIKMGYVKVKQLDGRKVSYILTPRGFSEKLSTSYNYLLKTINTTNLLKEKIKELILKRYSRGIRKFVIFGDGELSGVTEIALGELKIEGIEIIKTSNIVNVGDNSALIVCNSDYIKEPRGHTPIELIHLPFELGDLIYQGEKE